MAAELVEAGGGALVPVDPVARLKGIWGQPAVVAARPAIYAALAVVAGLFLWLGMREPAWRPLYGELSDGDKAAVMQALEGGNYQARINPQTGIIEVPEGEERRRGSCWRARGCRNRRAHLIRWGTCLWG